MIVKKINREYVTRMSARVFAFGMSGAPGDRARPSARMVSKSDAVREPKHVRIQQFKLKHVPMIFPAFSVPNVQINLIAVAVFPNVSVPMFDTKLNWRVPVRNTAAFVMPDAVVVARS